MSEMFLTESEPKQRSARWIVWSLAVGLAVLLIGSALVLVTRAATATGGASSPEELVDEMIIALNNEDLVALAELIEPAERRTLIGPGFDLVDELTRLEILAPDVDLTNVAGIEIELTDVVYEIEGVPGADDLRLVYLVGGTSSIAADPAQLALGSAILDRFDLEGAAVDNETSEITSDGDTGIVLVQRDSRWYLSFWYSVAEAMRVDAANDTDVRADTAFGSVPSVDDGPVPLGSDSPEAAVEAMLRRAVQLDLEGVIVRLDPEEAGALYRYSPLFLDDARAGADEALAAAAEAGFRWELTDMGFDVDADGDNATVTLRSFTAGLDGPDMEASLVYSADQIAVVIEAGQFLGDGAIEFRDTGLSVSGSFGDGIESLDLDMTIEAVGQSAVMTGTLDGEPFSASVLDGADCTEFTIDFDDRQETGCVEDLIDPFAGLTDGQSPFGGPGFGGFVPDGVKIDAGEIVDSLAGLELPGFPLRTHRIDGDGWFVSPTMSIVGPLQNQLSLVEPADLDVWLDLVATVTQYGLGAAIFPTVPEM